MTTYRNCQGKEAMAYIPFTLPSIETANPDEPLGSAWFNTIPSERIGLNGEYDYYGLQKRVERAFQEQADEQCCGKLVIKQRGRVVILSGQVRDKETLWKLIAIAQGVRGVSRVEVASVVLGTSIGPS
ncbi:MAG: phospholipid-binding protein [Leptolyngbyaceae cyanobacterium]